MYSRALIELNKTKQKKNVDQRPFQCEEREATAQSFSLNEILR